MFKDPFSFDGRIRRTEYCISLIMYAFSYFVALTLITTGGKFKVMLALVILVPSVWFLWAQCAKRCHDLGKSGWFQLIPFYIIWLLFAVGDSGSNEYGANPKLTIVPPAPPPDNSTPDGAPPKQSN